MKNKMVGDKTKSVIKLNEDFGLWPDGRMPIVWQYFWIDWKKFIATNDIYGWIYTERFSGDILVNLKPLNVDTRQIDIDILTARANNNILTGVWNFVSLLDENIREKIQSISFRIPPSNVKKCVVCVSFVEPHVVTFSSERRPHKFDEKLTKANVGWVSKYVFNQSDSRTVYMMSFQEFIWHEKIQ